MKKKLDLLALWLLLLSLLFTSCKKEETKLKNSDLIIGTWKVQKYISNYGDNDINLTPASDDFIKFESNGTFKEAEEDNIKTGTYVFNTDQTQVTLIYSDQSYILYSIKKISSNELIIHSITKYGYIENQYSKKL